MSGTLYVVATPIGNLEDITLRALRVLREVAVIAAEDTRRTARLLAHHAIPTKTVSFHEHNARMRVPQLMSRLEAGESIAVVSDAGTPGVSDPGPELVRACIERGIPIEPVPGPSATLAALVTSGFPVLPSTLLGFPPSRSKDRTRFLSIICSIPHTVVLFEAPHRLEALLKDLAATLGERPLCLAREVTKVHEEFLWGSARTLAERLKMPRGEFTLVVGPAPHDEPMTRALPDSASLDAEFRHLTEIGGLQRRAAVTELARRYGRPAREVYARIEAAKSRVP